MSTGGGSSSSQATGGHNPRITSPWTGYDGKSGLPAYNPARADSTVLLAGLMGLRPNKNPALTTNFNAGSSGGLARKPVLAKRVVLGGA